MSTIEEAREQARAAAEIVEHRLAGRWLGGSLVREADKDVPALRTSLHALRALLDATEPQEAVEPAEDEREPRPITDEMVEAAVDAAWNKRTVGIGGQVVYGPPAGLYRMVRAALEAAEEARR